MLQSQESVESHEWASTQTLIREYDTGQHYWALLYVNSAVMAAAETTIKKALDQLKSTLSAEDARMFSDTSLRDIWLEAREIEKEQGARTDLKNMRRVQPLLQCLESYAGIIEVFCQGYAPMAFVWGPIKLMLQLARNHSNVMEKILQAFSDLASALPRLDRLRGLFREDAHVHQVLGLIYSDITEFNLQAYKIFRRKAWHVWFACSWGIFERRFDKIVQKLRIHCGRLDQEAAAAHFLEMRKFRDNCHLEEDDLERRHIRMARDVLGWLSAGENRQEERLHEISDDRQLEACNWVLDDPQVRSWIEDDYGEAVLWMTGIPGAGKSFLCSLIIENLQTQPQRSTLYYFCSHRSSSESTCAKVLRTLAFQLLQQNMDMAVPVHQAFLQSGSNQSGPAMRKLLAQVLLTTKFTRIVVDGIDELDHTVQMEVLKSLAEIQKSAKDNCKLLVCSREEPLVPKALRTKNHCKLGNKTSEGLGHYIKKQVKDLQVKFGEMGSELVRLVEQRLYSKAKGMFLWVRLVTTTLMHQMSEAQLELAIDRLPEGLDEAYGLITRRINALCSPSLREPVFAILYWVCVARRPIGIHEVADGIALHAGLTILNRRTRSSNLQEDIVELCAPLLERSGKDVLDLVHFSAKEFFLNAQSGPFIDIAKAHLSIALSCVINLTTCLDMVPGYDAGVKNEDLESRVVQGCYGLQSYGHEFWAEHVLAFLATIGDSDPAARQLMDALEVFSRVWKHHTQTSGLHPSGPETVEGSIGLSRLRHSPRLYHFLSGWLGFKAKLKEARRNSNALGDQQQWQLETDETYLSLIDNRLNTITERLLMLDSSQLPLHIDKSDYQHFKSRFSFSCRFLDCHQCYDSIEDRNSHEASHVPSFPCLSCDFSGRGFRTRKDLEKHTQKYHMSPEDFKIPSDLLAVHGQSCECYGINARSPGVSFSRSSAWTEQGRKALQQGFRHVLANFESEMAADDGKEQDLKKVTSKESNPTVDHSSKEASSSKTLDNIRDKIEGRQYESLADFKNDLRGLSRDSMASLKWAGDKNVDSNCDEQLEKALSPFPAFANFDSTDYTHGLIQNSSDPASNLLEGHTGSLDQLEKGMAHLDLTRFRARTPYWSLTERKELPELLQRYGRDFDKIADYLKTKTADEVDQHFVHLLNKGKIELLEVADLADARLQKEAYTNEPSLEPEIVVPETPVADRPSQVTSYGLSQLDQLSGMRPSIHPSDKRPLFQTFLDYSDNNDLQPRTQDTAQTQRNAGAEGVIGQDQTKKRRPRPRAFCPHCNFHENGLHDEYALEKHILRFHTATRRLWICEDISIDKSFLARCKPCSASKRYSSKRGAGKHLRDAHFNAETSAETLQRWMRVIEEPNPNMQENEQAPSADAASTTKQTIKPPKRQATEDPPTSRHKTKRQRTDGTFISLPAVRDDPNSLKTLPSIVAPPDGLKILESVPRSRSPSSLDKTPNEDDGQTSSPAASETEALEHDVVLPDVSFDNFLPGFSSGLLLVDGDGPPHRTNTALIRPDQIHRLPNLETFDKARCLDHVEALWYKLENASVDSSDYKEALENLTSLTRILMRKLRNWRRDSTFAPNIPFSI